MSEDATLALAWHITQNGWLKADSDTMTVDPDEAGRFTADQLGRADAIRKPGRLIRLTARQWSSRISGCLATP